MIRITNNYGEILISRKAIIDIIGITVKNSYGIVGMSRKNVQSSLIDVLRSDKYFKGVETSLRENFIDIDVYVVLEYGTNISEVARNLSDSIRYNLKHLTGAEAGKVDVHIRKLKVNGDLR
jgi:uncharacterized alkaline shock family protein YloU